MSLEAEVADLLNERGAPEPYNSLRERLTQALSTIQISDYEDTEWRQQRLRRLVFWMVRHDLHGLYRKGITGLHDHKGVLQVEMSQRPLPEQSQFLASAWRRGAHEQYITVSWIEHGQTMSMDIR